MSMYVCMLPVSRRLRRLRAALAAAMFAIYILLLLSAHAQVRRFDRPNGSARSARLQKPSRVTKRRGDKTHTIHTYIYFPFLLRRHGCCTPPWPPPGSHTYIRPHAAPTRSAHTQRRAHTQRPHAAPARGAHCAHTQRPHAAAPTRSAHHTHTITQSPPRQPSRRRAARLGRSGAAEQRAMGGGE